MTCEKYIGYADLGIATTIPSSGLSRLLSSQKLLSLNNTVSVYFGWTSSLGIVRMSREELTAHEKAPHVPLAQTFLERVLKVEMPVHGLYRYIKSGLLTDSSELISRGPAILRN